MSTRNFMNERETQEGAKKGVTRKSASSAKPKRELAGSVVISDPKAKAKAAKKGGLFSKKEATPPTKAEQKAARQKSAEKQREMERKYYNVPTAEYRQMRIIWWVCIGLAVVSTIGSWLVITNVGSEGGIALLVLAYVFIAAAIYIDVAKIKRIRKQYVESMMDTKAQSKQRRAEQKAARKAAQNPQPVAEEPKKKGLFGFGKSKN